MRKNDFLAEIAAKFQFCLRFSGHRPGAKLKNAGVRASHVRCTLAHTRKVKLGRQSK